MTPHKKLIKPNDVLKKFKPTRNDNSTKQSPSFYKQDDAFYMDYLLSYSKIYASKGYNINKF